MAPQQAASTTPDPAAYPPEPPAPRHFPQPAVPPPPRVVWPWTAFVLGLVSLAGVYFGRPYWKPTDAERIRRDLAELRTLLGRQSPDLVRAEVLGQKALDLGSSYPQFVGEAHYLLGCVHLKKVDDSPDVDGELREARQHFEKAEEAGVPEADQPRLAFRLGKVLHLTRSDPKQTLDYLKKGDDPDAAAERWQYLAETYLRLTPPDLKGAVEAAKNHVGMMPAGSRGRSRAYLRLAELHLKLNQVGPARHALEEIQAGDSAEDYDESRVLLARCLQAEGNFAHAATTWEQIKSKARPPIDRGTICYELGCCYWKSGRPEEARKVWDEAQALGTQAAQASLLRKAEMQLADTPNRAQAIPTLEDAFKTVHRSIDYDNKLYPRAQAEQLLETTCQQFMASGEWANAGKIADLLTRLAGATKGKALSVQVALAWGLSLQKESRHRSGQTAEHAQEEARKQFRSAATLAVELAEQELPPEEQIEWKRRAVNYYLMCNDKVDIQKAVDLMQKLPGEPNIESEMSFQKAVAWQHLGETDKAIEGYRACLTEGHPEQCRARYQMVRLMLEQPISNKEERIKYLDQALDLLAPNLDPKLRETHPEEAAGSAYLAGQIAYDKRDWVKAESFLSAALRDFPKHPDSTEARFMLARCYWYQAGAASMAANDDQLPQPEREAAAKRRNEMLEKTLQVAEPLEDELMKREQDQMLTDQEKINLRQVSFLAAECYFFREDFPEAVRRYNMLRLRYARQLEELFALAQLWQCYAIYLDRPEQGDATLGAMRELLNSLPPETFNGSSMYHKREFWEDWIARATPKPPEPKKDNP